MTRRTYYYDSHGWVGNSKPKGFPPAPAYRIRAHSLTEARRMLDSLVFDAITTSVLPQTKPKRRKKVCHEC